MTPTPSLSPSPQRQEEARNAIAKCGFIHLKDPWLGRQVNKMEENSVPFASTDGLEFYKTNVLDNPDILAILESLFPWFGLGLYRTIGAAQGDYAFRRSDPESEVESVVVQLWSPGSQVTFWEGSHNHLLPSAQGANDLWRAPRIRLTKLGLKPANINFENGGFSIRDTRVYAEVVQGHAITFAIATQEVLTTWWKPMKLPAVLKKTVDSMQGPKFGMNVAYF